MISDERRAAKNTALTFAPWLRDYLRQGLLVLQAMGRSFQEHFF